MTHIATYVLVDGDADEVFGACADMQRLGRPDLRAGDYPLGAFLVVEQLSQGVEIRLSLDRKAGGVFVAIEVADEVRPRIVRRSGPSPQVLRPAREQAAILASDLDGALRARGLAATWSSTRELALAGRGSSAFEGLPPAP